MFVLDGFHKMSIVENGTMDADKDEIQFYHKYFQKDQPELLKNIKRKVTTSKTSENNLQNILRHDDITKVLTDVKQLRGKQSNVDSQLSTMKQENAVLWRELALLRQKHMKQQQIVNKVCNAVFLFISELLLLNGNILYLIKDYTRWMSLFFLIAVDSVLSYCCAAFS